MFLPQIRLPTYLELVWNGLHDTTIIMLIVCALVGLALSPLENHKG
jgi:hypothetical protein